MTLSLRGVTIHNNSRVEVKDIGRDTDQEALLCHTDNTNCCGTEQTMGGRVKGEWYYPNGRRILSINEIPDNYSQYESNLSSNFLTNRFQSVIRLYHGGNPSEEGRFCCEIPDHKEMNQTLCVTIGKNCFPCNISVLLTVTKHAVDSYNNTEQPSHQLPVNSKNCK